VRASPTPTVSERFQTVAGRGESGFEIRGSEFLGHVAPARTVEAAKSFVERVGEAYDDSTHVVPAYRVRADPLREWASDAGEPSGSAGEPALNVLEGAAGEFEATYEERVRFAIDAPADGAAGLRDRLRSATSGRAEIENDSQP